ncbi:MAG: 1-deoxy-D-xylulose-5-phosphate reductoisomerase, partial [Proteobacteria bacterium]|nr:1-deoxy-D-xylulose-5-phosphate reductoisomerase [Pseudomonadota bacterium]
SGGTLPAVLNAANEVAVAAFLAGNCSFPAIWETVATVMEAHAQESSPDLDAILAADADARRAATALLS